MSDVERCLTSGHPDLAQAVDSFVSELETHEDDTVRVQRLWRALGRLVPLGERPRVCVLGCGPRPQVMKILKDHGARPVGVEPLLGFVRLAGEYLGDPESVLQGAAEAIPLPDESQDVVLFESVLEHVDSPAQSLQEIFRVLKPGGVAYVVTTNRLQFSWRGANGEYQVPFYNWLPSLVKESYVFAHLHYRPRLANYSPRPAVHWFTYASLCRLGRDAGFAQFYSPLDLRMPSDFASSASRLKRVLLGGGFLLRALQRSAWLRSLALTQVGEVIMWKRSTFDVSA